VLAITRATLQGARASIVGAGLAAEAEVDAIADELVAASGREFRGTLGPLGAQVIAEVP
jgi:hypothetical protein